MVEKQVQVKVLTDVDDKKVVALEDELKRLRQQKLQLQIEANTQRLQETEQRIQGLKTFLDTVNTGNTNINIDDSQIKKAEAELEALESEKIDIAIAVEASQLEYVRAEVEEIDGSTIDIDMQTSIQNVVQGISTIRQTISELKSNVDEVSQAGMQMEQNMAFLEMNLGAEKARDTMQQISDIVASMPGDDNTMRSVLSTAQALGNNLNPDEMKEATKTMADYMSGSATMGKMALESQQDIMKYLLDGNTAELERGSIVSSQVDKLKEATTFMERQKAMQQVLNDLGYGGISQQDTMLNKQAEWEGMIYNAESSLSSMWLTAEKGAMDYILQLNDATDGMLGMGIVAGQMTIGPFAEFLGGLGQMGMGLKALKGIYSALIPTQYAEGIAGWFSIGWIAAAIAAGILLGIAFAYLYENCDWFREGVNDLASALQWLVGLISSTVMSAFNDFTSQLGINTNDWKGAVLGFILFLPQLPFAVGQALLDAIVQASGFDGTFVEYITQAAEDAYYGFAEWIEQLPDKLQEELDEMIWRGEEFHITFPGVLGIAADLMVSNWQDHSGEHSPGFMYDSLNGELSAMANLPLTIGLVIVNNIANLGGMMVNGFISIGSRIVSGFSNALQGIDTAIQNCLDWGYNLIMNHPIVQAAIWLGNAVSSGFSAIGLGQNSPGKIVKSMKQELDWTSEAIRDSDLARDTANLGSSLSDGFNPRLNLGNAGAGVGGGDFIVNIYGDVDSDKRAKQIIDVIKNELNWNNVTAGRSV